MVRSWHIVLVSLLALQCSPLCSCALAQVIAGCSTSSSESVAEQQAATTLAAKLPSCPADRGDSRDNSCICVATGKAAIVAADKAEPFSGQPFHSTLLVADSTLCGSHAVRSESAEPPDLFAAQSLPRLN